MWFTHTRPPVWRIGHLFEYVWRHIEKNQKQYPNHSCLFLRTPIWKINHCPELVKIFFYEFKDVSGSPPSVGVFMESHSPEIYAWSHYPVCFRSIFQTHSSKNMFLYVWNHSTGYSEPLFQMCLKSVSRITEFSIFRIDFQSLFFRIFRIDFQPIFFPQIPIIFRISLSRISQIDFKSLVFRFYRIDFHSLFFRIYFESLFEIFFESYSRLCLESVFPLRLKPLFRIFRITLPNMFQITSESKPSPNNPYDYSYS